MLTFLDYLTEARKNNYGEKFEEEFSSAIKYFSKYYKPRKVKNDNILLIAKRLLSKILDKEIDDKKKYDFEVVDEA